VVAVRQNLTHSYPAVPDSIPAARREVSEFAAATGARQDELDTIRLAVSEAVTNVVRHAYRDGFGEIHLCACVAGGELWVLVDDEGRGLREPSPAPGLGLGLALIASSAEGFDIFERGGGGTAVRMRFRLRGALAA
jgi:serine/threonine-protein kinase RsbW